MTRGAIHTSWIIGYGNIQRRDDGIGPYIVGRLKKILKRKKEIRFLALQQLGVDMVEELREANHIIFVDATIKAQKDGWNWVILQPKTGFLPYLTHHIHPSFLLGFLRSLYHRSPHASSVTVQGSDFEFGEGLSALAKKRAEKAISEIVKYFTKAA